MAKITPLDASRNPRPANSRCAALLPRVRREHVAALIQSEPVVMFGMSHMRCTIAASERLQAAGACFKHESWTDPNEPLWQYMKCLHPHEFVGNMEMHSYVYVGGEYLSLIHI